MRKAFALLVLMACFVLSASVSGETIRLTAENTFEKIGNTTFSFDVPAYDNLDLATADGDVDGYEYVSVSVQYYNFSTLMLGYVEVAYYENGRPPNETSEQALLKTFCNKTGGCVYDLNESYTVVSGYPAKVWDVYNPMNHREGFVAWLIVDDQRTVGIIADYIAFEPLQRTFQTPITDVFAVEVWYMSFSCPTDF